MSDYVYGIASGDGIVRCKLVASETLKLQENYLMDTPLVRKFLP